MLRLENGVIFADPPESRVLQCILKTPVYLIRNGKLVGIKSQLDPQVFLENLYHEYRSP
jgi:hypothetical protein